MSEGQQMVRALFRAIDMSPYSDRGGQLHCKIYYPALYTATEQQRNTGLLPALDAEAPRPVAILMPGINVAAESYGWMARALAESGFIALTYGWIVEEMPGLPALSPGLDIHALAPDEYGTRASATALTPIIEDLCAQNAEGLLQNQIDVSRILLGGHSAGGSVALMNARSDWHAGLQAVFAYGAHSKASTMLGYPEDTYLALPQDLPTLIMGGSEDGVIAASAFRYGKADGPGDAVEPLRRTFNDALQRNASDSHLAIFAGANHFSPCFPADPATGRPFLDRPCTRDEATIRADLKTLVTLFARSHLHADDTAAAALQQHLQNPEAFAETLTR